MPPPTLDSSPSFACDLTVAGRPARPENYARSIFHMACGSVALTTLCVLPNRASVAAASGGCAMAAWGMEAARRRSPRVNDSLMRFFGAVAHPSERHRVNSSTWYATALFLIALVAPRHAAELAVLTLAFADPAAGFIGRRFGRIMLAAKRSLEGSLGFVLVGFVTTFGWLTVTSELALPVRLLLSATAAVTGALTEIVSVKLDDNFTIPTAVAAAVAGVATITA